ncbi:hypothetical protein NLU13_9070 [Sarocladium strictum]|uniref:Glutaredoxin-like protein n=1 Tax=Sarocladium strictum TaxID=5046 RepID=A0AA39GBN4_SARSR|nr:hypothetical protein NLU13_9070 [Sarocladium strictum]
MFATRQLFQACRITLFTRETCGLCTQAKGVLSTVWDQRPFVYKEIDVDKTEVKTWKELYDYDVPVIHIANASSPEEDPKKIGKAVKLMHRFTPDQVQDKMDQVEES